MSIEAGESTGLGITVLGAVVTWMVSNPAEMVGAVCATIGTLVVFLKYIEERPRRLADAELARLQLEEARRAMEDKA